MHVEYQYNLERDQLEQSRDKLKVDFADGKCVVQARETETAVLARADQISELRELEAPVGRLEKPSKSKEAPSKKAPTKTPQKKLSKTEVPFDPGNVEKKPTPTYTKSAPKPAPNQAPTQVPSQAQAQPNEPVPQQQILKK